jgi:hypothetical protein
MNSVRVYDCACVLVGSALLFLGWPVIGEIGAAMVTCGILFFIFK